MLKLLYQFIGYALVFGFLFYELYVCWPIIEMVCLFVAGFVLLAGGAYFLSLADKA